MEYSPHLKKAMEEIKEVLERYDIAGFVILHSPGNTEYVVRIDPTYSCAKITPDGIKVRAKLSDFKGDKSKQKQVLTHTCNMLRMLTDNTAEVIYPYFEVANKLDEALGATHGPSGHTSITTQSN